MKEHDDKMRLMEYLLLQLGIEQERRHENPNWLEDELLCLVDHANFWAEAWGYEQQVDLNDVERFDRSAMGHVDYSKKICLYVADFIIYGG